jgi:hypothetical protein
MKDLEVAKLDRQELVYYLDKYSCIDNIELIRKTWQSRQPLRDVFQLQPDTALFESRSRKI